MCKIWEASTDCQAESSQPVLPSAASRRARGKHRLRDPQGFVLDTLQMIFRTQGFERFLLRCRRRQIHARVIRATKLLGQFFIPFTRITPGCRDDFSREQRKNDAVLVRCPDRSVATKKTGARAFFAAKTDRAVEQAL